MVGYDWNFVRPMVAPDEWQDDDHVPDSECLGFAGGGNCWLVPRRAFIRA